MRAAAGAKAAAEAVEASAAAVCGELALVVTLMLITSRDDDIHVSDRGLNSTRSARHTCSSFVLLGSRSPSGGSVNIDTSRFLFSTKYHEKRRTHPLSPRYSRDNRDLTRCETGIPHLKGDQVPDAKTAPNFGFGSRRESLRGSESVDPFGAIRVKTMFFDGRRRRRCKDIGCKKLDDPHSLKHNEMVECRFQPQQRLRSLPNFTKRLAARSKTCHTVSTPLRWLNVASSFSSLLVCDTFKNCKTFSRAGNWSGDPRESCVVRKHGGHWSGWRHEYVTCSFEPSRIELRGPLSRRIPWRKRVEHRRSVVRTWLLSWTNFSIEL